MDTHGPSYFICGGRFDVVIHERSPYRMVRSAVYVSAVGTFAVCRFRQLESRIRADVFDVFRARIATALAGIYP